MQIFQPIRKVAFSLLAIFFLAIFSSSFYAINNNKQIQQSIGLSMQQVSKQWFSAQLSNTDLIKKLKNVKLIISDIDGALTDGTFMYTNDTVFARSFCIQEGSITKQAMKNGIQVAFLSGKNHNSAFVRAQELGIPDDLCYIGKEDKLTIIKKIQKNYGISSKQTLMYGDDTYDVGVKTQDSQLLLAIPANAPFYYTELADLVLPLSGGNNAFRLLMDLILYVQGNHFDQDLIKQCLS